MRLLVTGASGLLGTRLCELAIKKNHEIYAVYHRHPPVFGTRLGLDITREEDVGKMFEVRPEAVVHAAAMSDVDMCEKDKELAYKMNVEATANIAKLCQRKGAFLVFVSTDYVFNGTKGQYKESDATDPINEYGRTKLQGEKVVEEAKIEHCIARTSVIYGANSTPGRTNFGLWLVKRLEKKERTMVTVDQWNSPTLNTNLAEMILEIVEKRITGTLNLAGATRLSRYEFAQNIARTFDLDTELLEPVHSKELPWLAMRPKDSSLNTETAERVLYNKPMQIGEAMFKFRMEMS